jgi:hypothetical protein
MAMPDNDDAGLVSASSLKKNRGWTESMIGKLLGAPAVKKPNPHCDVGRPARFWDAETVELVELGNAFPELREAAARRSIAARNAASAATKKAIQIAKDLEIVVPDVPIDEVVRAANVEFERRTGGLALPTPSITDGALVAYAYLVTLVSPVFNALDESYRRTGVCAARKILANRIRASITEKYPELDRAADEFDSTDGAYDGKAFP